jgi:hypothetical protein
MFTENDLIFAYTRAQAVEDGELIEFDTELRKEAGFNCFVDMTPAVFEIVKPNEAEMGDGQDIVGRQWDVLNLLRLHSAKLRNATAAELPIAIPFQCIFWVKRPGLRGGRRGQVTVQLKAVFGADMDGSPLITILLPHED